jgi:hypothetical protein
MSVVVTKTAGATAEITWEQSDDPHGWIARTVESDELAYALEALGDGEAERDTSRSESAARQAAYFTNKLAALLERRAATQVVRLRDDYGLSWREIAGAIHQDPEKQSTVRRQYETGRRHLGI